MTPVNDMQQRAAELAARATGPPPESWRPDKPELVHPNPIVGVLERVYLGPDRGWGRKYIAEVRDPNGMLWSVWLLGHVLENDFDQTVDGTPRPGDMIAIHYEGKRPKKDPQAGENSHYHAYRVVCDAADSQQRPPASAPAAAPPPFAGHTADPPEPAEASGPCTACGFLNGFHKDGCPLGDLPPF